MNTSHQHPSSPCEGTCDIDYDTGLCRGCLRTLQEIAHWPTMTAAQKQEVLASLEQRRADKR